MHYMGQPERHWEKRTFREKIDETEKYGHTYKEFRYHVLTGRFIDPRLPRRVDNARSSFETEYFISQSIPSFLKPPTVLHCSKEHSTLAFALTFAAAPAALGSAPSRHIESLRTSWCEKGDQLRVAIADGIATLLL